MEKLIQNLKARRFDAYHCSNKEEAVALALSFIKPNDIVGFGGSMTLAETGMLDALRKNCEHLLDRSKGQTPEQVQEITRASITADVYFASVNALSEEGIIYQTDGWGNRVAAIMYGAKSVVLLVGKNKIVKDEEAAWKRMREIACPKNAARLNRNTPCRKTGTCMDCLSPEAVCCNRVEMRLCRPDNRIKVILIDEDYGY